MFQDAYDYHQEEKLKNKQLSARKIKGETSSNAVRSPIDGKPINLEIRHDHAHQNNDHDNIVKTQEDER